MSLLYLFDNTLKFNPGLYAPAAWYDFTNSAYLNLSGSAITQALDRSGNGNNTNVQGTVLARPTFTTNQINGLPCAVFDGVANYLTIPNAANLNWAGNVTIFFVGDTATTSLAVRRFLGKVGNIAVGKGFNDDARLTTLGVQDYEGNAGFFAANTPLIACYTLGTYNVNFYKNNALFQTVTGNTPANTNTNDLIISPLGEPWSGRIGDIIIYNGLLSVAQIAQVNFYLSRKYNLPYIS